MKTEKALKAMKSWTISDEFWDEIKEYIPEHKRDPEKTYKRAEGGGRKPLDKRKVLEGIFYVLRTGCQWKAVPKEYGSGSSIHRYFQEWCKCGFFELLWRKGLEYYNKSKGIKWEWTSIDGCMVKAPLAKEDVGKNPTDRGKGAAKGA